MPIEAKMLKANIWKNKGAFINQFETMIDKDQFQRIKQGIM